MELKPMNVTVTLNNPEEVAFLVKMQELCNKHVTDYEHLLQVLDAAVKLDDQKSPGYSAGLLLFALDHWC